MLAGRGDLGHGRRSSAGALSAGQKVAARSGSVCYRRKMLWPDDLSSDPRSDRSGRAKRKSSCPMRPFCSHRGIWFREQGTDLRLCAEVQVHLPQVLLRPVCSSAPHLTIEQNMCASLSLLRIQLMCFTISTSGLLAPSRIDHHIAPVRHRDAARRLAPVHYI